MRRIDAATKPILTPLILGNATSLDKVAQQQLATWLTMKFMVAEFAEPMQIVTPQSERDYLMKNKLPLPNWRIWIGKVDAEAWRLRYRWYRVNMDYVWVPLPNIPIAEKYVPKNTQSLAFGIGKLYAYAISTTSQIDFGTRCPPLSCIWPYQRDILWPPSHVLNDFQATLITNSLDIRTRSPQVIWQPRI